MIENGDRFELVLTTTGSADEARTIARTLVERRLAACINIVDGVRSIFRWKGEIEEANELLLVIKTEGRLVEQVRRAIRELHTYDVPEVLTLRLEGGDPDYLTWLDHSLAQPV